MISALALVLAARESEGRVPTGAGRLKRLLRVVVMVDGCCMREGVLVVVVVMMKGKEVAQREEEEWWSGGSGDQAGRVEPSRWRAARRVSLGEPAEVGSALGGPVAPGAARD